MALDFPASPVNNQIFVASNGVTYQFTTTPAPGYWYSTQSIPPVAVVGDFMATNSAVIGVGAATVQIIPNVIVTGNSGNWYNPANGRYTPPAGRYYISFSAGYMGSGAAATIAFAYLRKNGTQIIMAAQVPAGPGWYGDPDAHGIFDCNGTDFFEAFVQGNSASTQILGAGAISFMAFPISGMKGLQGDPGPAGSFGTGFRLLARTTLAIAAADISYQAVPTDINDLMFSFDVTPSVNDQTLQFQFYDTAGTLDNVSGHYACGYFQCWNSLANGTAPSAGGGNGFGTGAIVMSNYAATAAVGTASGIRGKGFIPNIRAARPRSVEWSANYTDSAAALNRQVNGSGWRNIAGSITGFRLVFGNGLAAGSVLSTWGSP